LGPTKTVIAADAEKVGSAALVAVTKPVPAPAGAVYSPAELIVPIVAVQVTISLVVVP